MRRKFTSLPARELDRIEDLLDFYSKRSTPPARVSAYLNLRIEDTIAELARRRTGARA
jgi:hypothetical protein